jgi:hypothetical protein
MDIKRCTFILLGLFSCVLAVAASPDLSSPETTLNSYIESLRSGNRDGVLATYHGIKDFDLSKPLQIDKYKITKKIIYDSKKIRKLNLTGITPPAEIGDVELDVREVVDGKNVMFSYNFRKFKNGWMIIDHTAWDPYAD